MQRWRRYALTGLLGWSMACSRDPGRPPEPAPAKPFVANPYYSAASIAPSGSTKASPLAPGRIVTIYGTELGPMHPCRGVPDASLRETPHPGRPRQTKIELQVFPNTLCETEVLVGGIAAGLLYVSSGQINFKVPQTARAQGTTTVQVRYQGREGPLVSVALAVAAVPQASPEQIAASMWAALRRVNWERQYAPETDRCLAAPARQALRGGLWGHAYYCAQSAGPALAETFYYPTNPAEPQILLRRADIRPAEAYPELSAEVEQILVGLLVKAYGPGTVSEPIFEIGANAQAPGSHWRAGELAIFLHRNPSYAEPVGVRHSVVLVAVHKDLLEQRRTARDGLSQPAGVYFSGGGPPPSSEAARAKAERTTLASLLQLLRRTEGEPEPRAAALAGADRLAHRLGALLVKRSQVHGSENLEESEGAAGARRQLARYGIQFGGMDHYSGDLMYDHALLQRAWREFPAAASGQRAFLMLQSLGCATPRFGCSGPNCFADVIRKGEDFLAAYPDTPYRREQLYHLALANETQWSLGQAKPDDLNAMGAGVTPALAERARQRAVELYERIWQDEPGTPEGRAAAIALPRLNEAR